MEKILVRSKSIKLMFILGEIARVSTELKRLIAANAESRASVPASTTFTVTQQPEQRALELPLTPVAKPSRRGLDQLSPDQARAELIDLRENSIKVEFPDADPARGLLRKSMLDELLRKRPRDLSEFRAKIPIDLRQNTDSNQLKKFGEAVFEILERTA